jgi:hypothetical protein
MELAPIPKDVRDRALSASIGSERGAEAPGNNRPSADAPGEAAARKQPVSMYSSTMVGSTSVD